MDKNDAQLKKILENIKLPEPDENAQKRAVNLSMAAFKEHQKESVQKKNSNLFQGFWTLSRLMSNSKDTTRREHMNSTSDISNKSSIFTQKRAATAMALILVCSASLSYMVASSTRTGGGNAEATSELIAISQDMEIANIAPTYRETIQDINKQRRESSERQRLSHAPESSLVPVPLTESKTSTTALRTQQSPKKYANSADKPQTFAKAKTEIARNRFAQADISTITKNNIIGDADDLVDWEEVPKERLVQEKKQVEELKNRDKFERFAQNPIILTEQEPVSTFSIDVDTASYSYVRRSILKQGRIPHKNSVRIEEMVNYFDYDYQTPIDAETPFLTTVNVTPSPWSNDKKLMHIGIQGYDIEHDAKPHTNLVFLLDVSGSMNRPDKLPLVKKSMKMLLDSLNNDDHVSIVVYAGAAGVVLEPTQAKERNKIYEAFDKLKAGGSTAGGAGIEMAYKLAQKHYSEDGINRVILATDGDFNVGLSKNGELQSFIEEKRKTGVFLSILGFGQGNLNDSLMQTLAQNGNGTAAYIDSEAEARKVLVEEAGSTLFPIAKDVKIQMEFNPDAVKEYRLVGYETRNLRNEDFDNDAVDAGDIGAGHSVTAIYEFLPNPEMEANTDFAKLKMRYKRPDENASRLLTQAVTQNHLTHFTKPCGEEEDCIASASEAVRFSIAVAAFGDKLKGGEYTEGISIDQIIVLAKEGKGEDQFGYRAEFIEMVQRAKELGLR